MKAIELLTGSQSLVHTSMASLKSSEKLAKSPSVGDLEQQAMEIYRSGPWNPTDDQMTLYSFEDVYISYDHFLLPYGAATLSNTMGQNGHFSIQLQRFASQCLGRWRVIINIGLGYPLMTNKGRSITTFLLMVEDFQGIYIHTYVHIYIYIYVYIQIVIIYIYIHLSNVP